MSAIDHCISAIETLVARCPEPFPSYSVIRNEAGGGNFSTISDAVRIYRARTTAQANPIPNAPVPTEISSAVEDIWQRAKEAAHAALAAERAALVAARRELEQSQSDLVETADELASAVDGLTHQLEAERARCYELEGDLQSVRAELLASEKLVEKLSTCLAPQKKNSPAAKPRPKDSSTTLPPTRDDVLDFTGEAEGNAT